MKYFYLIMSYLAAFLLGLYLAPYGCMKKGDTFHICMAIACLIFLYTLYKREE